MKEPFITIRDGKNILNVYLSYNEQIDNNAINECLQKNNVPIHGMEVIIERKKPKSLSNWSESEFENWQLKLNEEEN